MNAAESGLSVSVALCTYNGAPFIEEQLASILRQDRPVDEIVVSDDGSTDDTLDRVTRLLAAARRERPALSTRILRSEQPLGVTGNFDRAVGACSGDVIVLSDQDDVWTQGRLREQLVALASAPSAALVFGDARLVSAEGVDLGGTLFEALEVHDGLLADLESSRAFATLLRRNIVTGATVAFRRELLVDARPFPSEWVHDEWLAIVAAARGPVIGMRRSLTLYRQHGSNTIGVVRPTLRNKVRRTLAPRGGRTAGLAARSTILAQRLFAHGADPELVRLAFAKAEFERFRARLPERRIARVVPVSRRAASGDYLRFASRGALDIVRDLLQPA